jgi:hypothetical protein
VSEGKANAPNDSVKSRSEVPEQLLVSRHTDSGSKRGVIYSRTDVAQMSEEDKFKPAPFNGSSEESKNDCDELFGDIVDEADQDEVSEEQASRVRVNVTHNMNTVNKMSPRHF